MSIKTILNTLHLRATLSGMNLFQLSLAAGLGQDTVSRWVNGARKPKAAELDAALRVVGMRLEAVDNPRDPTVK